MAKEVVFYTWFDDTTIQGRLADAWRMLSNHGFVCVSNMDGIRKKSVLDMMRTSVLGVADYRGPVTFEAFLQDVLDGKHDKTDGPHLDENMMTYLLDWAASYAASYYEPLFIEFTDRLPVNFALMERAANAGYRYVTVGIGTAGSPSPMDLVKATVSLFHMLGHCSQNPHEPSTEDIVISSMSTYKNIHYRCHDQHVLPDEIDAEFAGIVSAWEQLQGVFVDKDMAGKLVGKYVTELSERQPRMFQAPIGGFRLLEQVKRSIADAFRDSTEALRQFPEGWLSCSDAAAQILGDNGSVRKDYVHLYDAIAHAKSGKDMDRKMASLMLYVFPELKKLYSLATGGQSGDDEIKEEKEGDRYGRSNRRDVHIG